MFKGFIILTARHPPNGAVPLQALFSVADSQDFLHVVDGHINTGPEFECCSALEKHHAEAVHVLAADFLCDPVCTADAAENGRHRS